MVFGQEKIVELIEVEGNYRTKLNFITKIIPVKVGDTLTELEQHFLEGVCQTALINTKLFNSVEVSFVTSSSKNKLHIEVTERWYLYPSPHLALADRNFNEWWVDRNHDFTRLVVGGTLLHKNISGHGDELFATVWTGFERRAIIDYKTPYLHHSKKWGFKTHFEWVENKNLAVATQSNKLVYWKSENVLRTVLFGQLSLIYQPKFLEVHEISIGLHNCKIADTVALFNPNYLPEESSKTSQTAFRAGYTFINDKRNRKGYPTKGYLYGLSANHAQFFNGLHLSSVSARINLHHPINAFHFSSQTQAFTSFGTTQPYFLQRGFGWNNNLVRGYNYHVIEAEHFAIQKLEFGRMLTPLQKRFNKLPRQFNLLSLTPLPKAFLDFGYTSSQQFAKNGSLNNQFLLGYGLGLDLVYYYDNLWRIEYARSIHGTSGLFLNFTMFIQ